jgi:hypothetical protein
MTRSAPQPTEDMLMLLHLRRWFLAAVTLATAILFSLPANAQGNVWTIAKSSGEAWVTRGGAQQVSLSQQVQLMPGDAIRTGRNGRVLLMRGAESLMISPNSAVSVPEVSRVGTTTLIQQAGSILLDVEKRNVPHFEVETPYLAAVVKGTRFRVTVANGRSRVDVVRGQVQVADFRSGQFALVLPGQAASVRMDAQAGLRLSGQGALGRIEQGQPQAQRVAPIPVPTGGLRATPGSVPVGSQAGTDDAPRQRDARAVVPRTTAASAGATQPGVTRSSSGGMRINAAIGEVKLDIRRVTGGLIGDSQTPRQAVSNRAAAPSQPSSAFAGIAGNAGQTGNAASAAVQAGGTGPSSGAAATASGNGNSGRGNAVVSGNSGSSNAGGNGNGNAFGLGNGNSGTGNANGIGNGNSGSGSNNAGGNGNGNAFGLNGGNGNGNAFGLGNGNSGQGNAGGNGNGNSGSGSNNSGGNGNGNAFGLNGGNGNGNAFGLNNGNSGSGSNNAGGNGNGNGGGNGNGKKL